MVVIYSALFAFSIVLLVRGEQVLIQHDQSTAPSEGKIEQLSSSMIHVASSDKRVYGRPTLQPNSQSLPNTFAIFDRQPWEVRRRRLYPAVPHKSSTSLSVQLDEPVIEVKIASTKPFAAKSPSKFEKNEESVHSLHTTQLYNIPLIDKSTNSVHQQFPSNWEDNVSRLNKQPGLQSEPFLRVSERFERIRKRKPADTHQVYATHRRHKKRKAAMETDIQQPIQYSSAASDAAVTMTPLSELEIKSDQDLQKYLHRTTMRTVNYGSLEATTTTTPIALIGARQPSSSILPPYPHSPPLAQNMPPLTASSFPPFAQSGGSSKAAAANAQISNGNKTEQYEQLGCGFDLISQSCKDVFGIGWCQQCHDFGNIFLHDCKCTSGILILLVVYTSGHNYNSPRI